MPMENHEVVPLNVLRAAMEREFPDPVVQSTGSVYAPTMVLAVGDGGSIYQMLDSADGSGRRMWRKCLSLAEAVEKFGGTVMA